MNNVYIMPGHPNQSKHITSSTAKCLKDAKSDSPDQYNLSFRKLYLTLLLVIK